MKVSMSWLRKWVEWPQEWDPDELARRLTLAGFEIEAMTAAAPMFTGVVVARIIGVETHPQADRLQVCRVIIAEADEGAPLQIVCGAANARVGLVTALATVGASLPDNVSIRAAKLRGVQSAGMLCSARELGLAEVSEGIIELPAAARLGLDLRRYMDLDDRVFEVNVTPNRGDAMSVLGIAREVAALTGTVVKAPDLAAQGGAHAAAPDPTDPITVTLQPGVGAGRFLARTLR